MEKHKQIAIDYFSQYCDLIPFKSRDDWLKMRMEGIGGSDVSCILGHNPWKNRKDIYWSKKKEQEEISNFAIEFGNDFEPLIFQSFKNKYKEFYETLDFKDIMFRNIFIPYFQASLDGVLIEKETNKVGILEIKTVQNKKSKWYYSDGTKGVPQSYIDQAIHYFNTTNAEFVIFYCLVNYTIPELDRDMEFLTPRRIDRDDVQDYMKKVESECINFWENYVKKDKEPNNLLTF